MYYGRDSLIRGIAEFYGWESLPFQANIGMASFVKGDERINVYVTKMTVATCLNHPKKGKKQLFRKNVTPQELELIFKKPRVHTGKGYYETSSNILR